MKARAFVLLALTLAAISCGVRGPPRPPKPESQPMPADAGTAPEDSK